MTPLKIKLSGVFVLAIILLSSTQTVAKDTEEQLSIRPYIGKTSIKLEDDSYQETQQTTSYGIGIGLHTKHKHFSELKEINVESFQSWSKYKTIYTNYKIGVLYRLEKQFNPSFTGHLGAGLDIYSLKQATYYEEEPAAALGVTFTLGLAKTITPKLDLELGWTYSRFAFNANLFDQTIRGTVNTLNLGIAKRF